MSRKRIAKTPHSPGAQTREGLGRELNPRDREILADIIRTYVLGGEPVSSRTLSKHLQHGLSSASIRNVMADLEDMGLLRQPHTSAGRVPTESAYRLYIESMMKTQAVSARERRYIAEQLKDAVDGDHLVSAVSRLLSELSNQVSVVLMPVVDEIVLKSADFVSMGGGRILCVMVSMSGFIDHVIIETEEDVSRQDLVRISNYVTENFGGRRLRDIRDQLVQAMVEDRRGVSNWLSCAMSLADQAISGPVEQEVLVKGTSTLLDLPELSDIERVRRMLDTFADKARLVKVLSRVLESSDGVRVFLGNDSDVTSELDFSLVAAPYGTADSTLGSLGIIGPSRMEYPRMVSLVAYLGETLSKALAYEGK